MIIMDFIDHEQLIPEEIQDLVSRRNIYTSVQRAIALLHSRNYVFGDLRTPNILVRTTNGVKDSIGAGLKAWSLIP